MNEAAFLELLKREVTRAGSATQFAKRHKITPSYLSYVLRGKMAPGPKILAALGYTRKPNITKAGRY